MTGEMKAKVRFVRCPRCTVVLTELADIPVYKCGGCGTILQAKHGKTETRGTELCRNETDENGKVEPDHIPEQKKVSCLNQDNIPSKGGSSAEASSSSLHDCNVKQPGDGTYSDQIPILSERLSHQENGDSSQELGQQREQDKHIGALDQDTEGKHESGDCCSQWHGAGSFSDDFPSSLELTSHETEDSSPEFQSRLSRDKDERTVDHRMSMDKKEHGDCKTEHAKGSNLHDKVSVTEDKHGENNLSPKFGAHGEEGKGSVNLSLQDCTNVECRVPETADCCRGSSSFTESNCGGAKKEMGQDLKDHRTESLKGEDNLEKNETDSIYAAETLPHESILVDNSISQDNQLLELSQNIIPRGFDRESSVDSFDKLPVDSPSSVFEMKQTDFSKSSMTRRYYGYDGSASSFDEYEDQISGQFSKPPRRKFKHSAFTDSNGLDRQEESRAQDFQMNRPEARYQTIRGSRTLDMLSIEPEIRQAARKSSSILDEKSGGYGMKHRQNNLDDLLESRSQGHPGASRSRVDKEKHASELSFIPRYFSGGKRNGTPSNYQQHAFQPYSGSFSPDISSHVETDKNELLRMVYELKEELNKTHISKGRYFTGFTGDEMIPPSCYNHLAPTEEMCTDMHYPRYLGRCSPGTGLPQMYQISRMAFSGDAADYRHQVGCSCSCGCPQEWHCAAQLPSPMMCCNKAHRLGHIDHTCYKGSYSASSTPQHYKSSRHSMYHRETKSDDQSLRDTEIKRHVREKYYSSKRHLMPVAGGIPIVACYHCSELLQLPADFLLFGRRYHHLRCNACRKVMKFSLEGRTHLSPNLYDTLAPPPSMVDDCGDSIDQRDWKAASCSSKHAHAEPFSCSDDYGLSFDRSCTTEGEPSLMMPPLKPLESNTENRKSLCSSSSFQPLEDRKMKSILVESQETPRNSKENFRSEGPSLKVSKWGKPSSEIEKLPSASGSPLHRLMGYQSPSEVIKP